jgi:predicted NAD/FAD-binding protein
MPTNRKVWASWNFLGSSKDSDTSAVCVSYWVNRLQHLPPGAPDMFVTLNPPHAPAADKTYRRLSLEHPVFRYVLYGEAGHDDLSCC